MTDESRRTDGGPPDGAPDSDESVDPSTAEAPGASDPLRWTTLSAEQSYTCPGFDVITETVRLPDGTETAFDYCSEPPAVVVVPLTAGGEVVVIEEWRQAVGRINRGLPAGSVESNDENLGAAARRELAEETGYEADTVEHLVTVEPANGLLDSVHHYFLARGCKPAGEQQLDFNESIRVETTSVESLRSAVLDGKVRDGRTVLGVCYWTLSASSSGPE